MTVPRSAHRRLSDQRGWDSLAWRRILPLAQAAGAAGVYDPDNPETWTLRQDGGDLFYEEVADGLGNLAPLVQETAVDQPRQIINSTGRRVFNAMGATVRFMEAHFASTIAQPNTILILFRPHITTTSNMDMMDGIATNRRRIIRRTNSADFFMFCGTSLDAPSVLQSVWALGHSIADGANSFLQHNDDMPVSGDAGSDDLDGIRLMAHLTAAGNRWRGEVGPIIVFDGRKEPEDTGMPALRAALMRYYPIGQAG